MASDFARLIGKWELVGLLSPVKGSCFMPGEWKVVFLPEGKMYVFERGAIFGPCDFTFRNGKLTIGDGSPLRVESTDTLLIVHETDPDNGMTHYTVYRRSYELPSHSCPR